MAEPQFREIIETCASCRHLKEFPRRQYQEWGEWGCKLPENSQIRRDWEESSPESFTCNLWQDDGENWRQLERKRKESEG